MRLYKWIFGSMGPMIGVIAESEEQAKALAIETLKVMDPDDDPSHPNSWLNASDLEVIELDKPRVVCTA